MVARFLFEIAYVSLLIPFPLKEYSFLFLDFRLGHVTCFGQQNVSRHDTTTNLNCGCFVGLVFSCVCCSHEKSMMWQGFLVQRIRNTGNRPGLNPQLDVKPSQTHSKLTEPQIHIKISLCCLEVLNFRVFIKQHYIVITDRYKVIMPNHLIMYNMNIILCFYMPGLIVTIVILIHLHLKTT